MTVHLVGAGPGDPELLTVRAAALLQRCDVVIYDRLVSPEILDLVPESAERIDVGKRPGDSERQVTINEVLVDRGLRFECVVRLKGGDPHVFGRAAEELIALRAAGNTDRSGSWCLVGHCRTGGSRDPAVHPTGFERVHRDHGPPGSRHRSSD